MLRDAPEHDRSVSKVSALLLRSTYGEDKAANPIHLPDHIQLIVRPEDFRTLVEPNLHRAQTSSGHTAAQTSLRNPVAAYMNLKVVHEVPNQIQVTAASTMSAV